MISLLNLQKYVLKDIKTNTINFVVDGYASSLALLNEHQKNFGTSVINLGATITEIPKTKPWGQVVAYIRDLVGFLIEICTPIS